MQRHGLRRLTRQQRGSAGPVVGLVGTSHRDVRAEASGPHDDVEAACRIGAQHPFGGRSEQLECAFDGELVGREVVGQRPGGVAAPQVRPEASHPRHHRFAFAVGTDGDAVDLGRVDIGQPVVGDEVAQAAGGLGRGGAVIAEIERRQPRLGVALAARDLVEVLFHAGRQRVVDQVIEVPLHQAHGGERGERRHQRRALLPHVPACLDGLDDAGVGAGPADAQLLEPPHQRRLGEPGRRARAVLGRFQRHRRCCIARVEVGQDALGLLIGTGRRRCVDEPEAGTAHHGAGGGQLDAVAPGRRRALRQCRRQVAGCRAGQPDRDGLAGCIDHLAGHGALPHEVVQPGGVAAEIGDAARSGPAVAGGADGLVRLLGVLDLAGVDAGLRRQVVFPVAAGDDPPGRTDRLPGQRGAVGAHVGDATVLVQPLGRGHRARGGEAQPSTGRLLQRRGDERRRWAAPVRLGFA